MRGVGGRAKRSGVKITTHRSRKPFSFKNPTPNPYGEKWPAISRYVKKRDNYTCQAHRFGLKVCRVRLPPPLHSQLHAHHIIPRAKGGIDHPKNAATLCTQCHGIIHGRKLGNPLTKKQQAFAKVLNARS